MQSCAVGALAPDHGGQVGESAVLVLERHEARVQVVDVQDGQRPDLRRQRRAGEQEERQPARDQGKHTAPIVTCGTLAS